MPLWINTMPTEENPLVKAYSDSVMAYWTIVFAMWGIHPYKKDSK